MSVNKTVASTRSGLRSTACTSSELLYLHQHVVVVAPPRIETAARQFDIFRTIDVLGEIKAMVHSDEGLILAPEERAWASGQTTRHPEHP